MMNSPSYKVSIIAPTCFYYQAPLFRALASEERLDLTVYFCSDEGVSGKDVKTVYGTKKNWGVEHNLLKGYHSKFLRNYSPLGSYLKSLVGLANFGIWKELSQERPDVVVVMSWMNPTWWLIFLACLRFRIPMLFMTDANYYAEKLKGRLRSSIKRILLGKLIFPATSGFLCAGTANRLLYTDYGVPDDKLYPFAYSWGYSGMIEESTLLNSRKVEFRKEYGLPEDAAIILYSGRLSPEKGTIELIEAYKLVDHPKKTLVFVGDGQLQTRMQELADTSGTDSIYFMGFQNRSDIGKFYALADILVLPSLQETWGLVVNEALCFSLPVVVSDQVGAGADLVIPEENGYIFPVGEVSTMADRISMLLRLPDEGRLAMGEKSHSLVKDWANLDIAESLIKCVESIHQGPPDLGETLARGARRTAHVKSRVRRFFLASYRGLPEWFIRGVAFSTIGLALIIGFAFLSARSFLRQIWTGRIKLRS